MSQHIVTWDFEQSAYVSLVNPSINYSTQDYIRTGGDGDDNNIITYRGLLGFTDSTKKNIFKYKKIKSAVFHMYLMNYIPEPDRHQIDIKSHVILCNWNESTVTEANLKQGSNVISKSFYDDLSSGWHSFLLNHYELQKLENGITVVVYIPFDTDTFKIAGTRSTHKPYLVITYEDVPPEKPIPTEPSGVYVDNSSIIKFKWIHNDSMGGEQKKFDFQWSSDNGINWHTVTRTTSSNYYNMSANTLPAGNITWRVRTYNKFYEVSEYSEPLQFYAVGMPPKPNIYSVSAMISRLVVKWGSIDQQVYELELKKNSNHSLIYSNSGTLEKAYIIPLFLEDDTYKVRVRIKNKYDLWSLWGEYTINISTNKPNKPKINAMNTLTGITFTTSNETGIKNILYRKRCDRGKYIPVGIAKNGVVIDNTVANNVEYNYFIRAVHNNAFSDSNVIVETGILKYSLFSSINNLDDVVVLKYSKEKEHKDISLTCKSQENFYTGRSYQVTEYSPFMEKTYNLIFYVKTIEELIRFRNLLYSKNVILFRDKYTKEYGNITNVKEKQYRKGFSIEFTFKKTNHDEEIEV